MALIQKEVRVRTANIRIKVDNKVAEEVNAYCQWADIKDIGYFFGEAAKLVFARDKEWQKVQQLKEPGPAIV